MAKAKKAAPKKAKKASAKKPAKKAARAKKMEKLLFSRAERNWLDDVISFLDGAADGMDAHPTIEKNLRVDAAKYRDLIS